MTEPTRLDFIRKLVAHLDGEAPHRTPIEALRLCKYVPGWVLEKRTVGWLVSGPPEGECFVTNGGALVEVLRTHWLPQAREEVGAAEAGWVPPSPPASPSDRHTVSAEELQAVINDAFELLDGIDDNVGLDPDGKAVLARLAALKSF